jgi:hypothetical protein
MEETSTDTIEIESDPSYIEPNLGEELDSISNLGSTQPREVTPQN